MHQLELQVNKIRIILQQLDTFLNSRERFIILGDFNGRVGPRKDDQWTDVLETHCWGVVNGTGRELLSLSLYHEATACVQYMVWEKNIHRHTWI